MISLSSLKAGLERVPAPWCTFLLAAGVMWHLELELAELLA